MKTSYKETRYINLGELIGNFKEFQGKKIIVGPIAKPDSELAKYAAANEFGAEIRPKKGKFLAIPKTVEAKERSPRDFGKEAGEHFAFVKKVVIPERSWLRGAFDKKETIDKAVRIAKDALRLMIDGKSSAMNVLNAIGLSFVSSVKARISSNIPPSNAEITLLTKKGKRTLIEEGQLLKSIGHEVL